MALPAYDIEEIFPDEITLSEDSEPCPQCDCMNEGMGTLGSLVHYRCQDCGWIYTRDLSKVIK